ncbi:MAG: hypothetical protein MZV63_06000 [Marinilabiliales bacterium]|nr:hypothetical protein [Marinilabiliales bacterium]
MKGGSAQCTVASARWNRSAPGSTVRRHRHGVEDEGRETRRAASAGRRLRRGATAPGRAAGTSGSAANQ